MATVTIHAPNALDLAIREHAAARGLPLGAHHASALATQVAQGETVQFFGHWRQRGEGKDICGLLAAGGHHPPLPGDALPDDVREDLDGLYGGKKGTSS